MTRRIEFVENANELSIACTIVWNSEYLSESDCAEIEGFKTKREAVEDALSFIQSLKSPARPSNVGICKTSQGSSHQHLPDEAQWTKLLDTVQKKLAPAVHNEDNALREDGFSITASAALDEYLKNGQRGLDELLAASKSNSLGPMQQERCNKNDKLAKLVLARQTNISLEEEIDCCDLMASLQERDPKAYQFLLRLPTGEVFLGCTPERLYARTGDSVVSEAVAGTRSRGAGGDIEKDFWLAFDLLQSQKDGLEFALVRDSIMATFNRLCSDVDLEVDKSVLKQGSVQHLYGRVAGKLKEDVTDLDLIKELHPTPAVCGQPDEDALCLLRRYESFDRGFYAGPFGWFAHDSADISVAIRSCLICPPEQQSTKISLYAGVGIVPGSVTQSEWNELNLKIGQYTNILKQSTKDRLLSSPNMSILAAQLMVEELCRLGCNTFCIAPGTILGEFG